MENMVLVIDEHPATVDLLASQFLQNEWLVERALSSAEGIELMRRNPPQLVVCDVGMPDLSGLDVAEFIRASFGIEGPIMVATTGWTDPAVADQAIQAGFDLVLTKPIDFTHMLSMIVLVGKARSRPMQPDVGRPGR